MGPVLNKPYLVLTVLDAHNTENSAPNHHGRRLYGCIAGTGVTALAGFRLCLGGFQPAFSL